MNRKKEKNNILLYLLKMLLVFISIDLLIMIATNVIASTSLGFKYGDDLIIEIFYALFVLIVMLLFKNYYVFTNKQEKFLKSILLATPMLALSIIVLVLNCLSLKEFSAFRFINVVMLSLFIGIAEEFLCRGWLQNEFIERYSKNKKMVITSIILSSFVFGFMHILNVGSQTLFETILQIINATAIGFLLGSVYYKTKNIWAVIFLHAFYDFSIMIGDMNYIKDCTYNTPTTAIIIVNSIGIIFISFLWIFSAIKVLRKCDFPDKKAVEEKTNPYINLVIIVSFILTFVPFENLVYEYKDYRVCYDYNKKEIKEKFTLHYPYYNEYVIENNSKKVTYENEDNQEVISINNYQYKFYVDNSEAFIENINTGVKVKIKDDVLKIVVINNENNYILLIHTDENESTVYYSDFIINDNMSNDDDYLQRIKNSFIKFEFPSLGYIGYITFDGSDVKYPLMKSINNNYFMIENGKLYLLD